jgi:hypothetical protein
MSPASLAPGGRTSMQKLRLRHELVPGVTEGRFRRQRGYAAYGFAPVVMERANLARVHGIDKRNSGQNLLTGVKIARDMIEMLCVIWSPLQDPAEPGPVDWSAERFSEVSPSLVECFQ